MATILDDLARRRQHSTTMAFWELGSADSPVTTEMLVAANELKSSFNLQGVIAETWLSVLLFKMASPS